jgi:hypothetical protein
MQPLLQWKSNKYYIFWVRVCSLRYSARNAQAPYCHLWPAPLYKIFPHYPINGTIFGKKKKLLNMKCVFRFSLQILSEIFFILRRTERDMIKNVYWSSCKVLFIFVRLQWNLNFLEGFSKNTQISNFMKIRPVRAEWFHADRRTDRHDKTSSRFSPFCERTYDCNPWLYYSSAKLLRNKMWVEVLTAVLLKI